MPKDWPTLLIGLIVAAYWGRVIRLVLKTRRKTGRAGNFLPPEPLGRVLRLVWYPTVLAWIIHPLVLAFEPVDHALFTPLYRQPAVQWMAVAVAAVAFGFTLVCWKRMGKSWRMGIDPGEKTQLIVTGPYAYVRHPIYALSSLMMLGSVAAVPTPLMIVVGVIHVAFLQWEARREEHYLKLVHGEAYGSYLSGVGRFIPKLSAARTGAGG